MTAADTQTGISLRLLREWTPDPRPTMAEHAWMIAAYDTRACSFAEKFRDAYAFLQVRD